MLLIEPFLSGESAIPLRPPKSSSKQQNQERRSDIGLLSTLSSYLLSPYGSSSSDNLGGREVSEEDIENTLSAIDCVGTCKIDEVYSQIL
jgi:golgi-specific brefeldin A-resistance guanine nucleotide exchange factor 1